LEKKTPITDPRLFATTHWSVVLAVQDDDPARAQEALEKLCRSYWYPLYSYLRRHGYSPPDAEDLIQGFFEQLLKRQALNKADPERGRFRTFLLSCLKKFVADQHDRAGRQKRGGGRVLLPLDIPNAEQRYNGALRSDETPEQHYERQWAATTVLKVLDQLRAEACAEGHGELLGNLQSTLTGDKPSVPYAVLAQRLDMNEGAVKMAAHRLRKRYRALFREEIAHTVDRPEELEEEIAHLFQVLSR